MSNSGAEKICFGLIELRREEVATVASRVGPVRESALRDLCRCSVKVVSTLMDELDIPRTLELLAVGGFNGVKSVRTASCPDSVKVGTEAFEVGWALVSVEDFFS
jgi:hypothetical protein